MKEKDTVSFILKRKTADYDVYKIEKIQVVIKAQTFHYSLVSQQQKLCKFR